MNDVKWSFPKDVPSSGTQRVEPETHLLEDVMRFYHAAQCYLHCWFSHDSDSCYTEDKDTFDMECLCINKGGDILPHITRSCEYYTDKVKGK